MDVYCRHITCSIICLAVLALLLGVPQAARAQPVEVVPLWGPYLTGASQTGITVNWKTSGETAGAVEYATGDHFNKNGTYNESVPDAAKELHHVALTGLQPDTTYHYRVRIGEGYTAGHTFKTLGDGPFTFIVYGDTREQAPLFTQLERHKLVAERIAAEKNVSFVLHTGDLVCDGGDLAEWGRFFEAARPMLDKIPLFPVAGNHECSSPDYYEIFGVALYYSFGCGNAWFSMLDSNDGADLTAEAAWLAGDVPPGAAWKFAVCHHPLYTSDAEHWGGNPDLRERWEPTFLDTGMNAVFSAHVHVYERYRENGIQYVVLGTGGAPGYELAKEKITGYGNSLEHTLGYARITVDADRAVMEVIEVAEVSADNREVVRTYPPGTVFETVSLSPEEPLPLPPDSGFSIAPASLEVSIPGNKPGSVYVYVTSHFNGTLVVGTEGIPFQVEPRSISVSANDTNRKVKLSISGNQEVKTGEYAGKLTFLAYPGKNVAYGIKVDILVKQTGSTGFVAGLLDQFGGRNAGGGALSYAVLAVSGLAVIAALVVGILIGRRLRKPVGRRSPADDSETEDE
jgi:hypothetical protein